MIIEFSLTNFRSIASTQTLSLNASKFKGLDENIIHLEEPNKFSLLRSAAIYGANAAGKSNFMVGLRTMQRMIVKSASNSQSGDDLPVHSFKLDPELISSPSEFELTFIINNIRYQYGFSATKEKIIEEWLFAYPKGRPQRWFLRAWNSSIDDYEWDMGNYLIGEKSSWQKATKHNALFLSTAVQLNSVQLKPIFSWFMNKLRFTSVAGWNNKFSAKLCFEDKKDDVMSFLKAADLDIDDILVTKEKFDPRKIPNGIPDNFKELIIENMKDEEDFEIQTIHKNSSGELIPFDLDDESDGTKKLFSFAGPWVDSLKRGNVLFIDELHDNLHPKLVKFLVELFNNKKTNPNNAQLVFTTHETSILNQDVFRRDQIWFCEKDSLKATKIYPLTDFSPRKGRENLEAAYLDGRYGALPYVTMMENI
ncbi:MAG: ATP-binding protein [Ewingella americana]|jgi:AAA15 family ATPase/GTPase|uniref:AAA family ATPase n=1 Tax=Ewingella americana TaxID=41202 RepID=UPI00242E65B4|nr:ATP-binding protein [Ewingella americana]MCI1680036.1 ATP-binding protein [Ewingella americana]MCI1855031.1 ATP-binding protein [Ewingella americana]MCI1863508.1 ATP-binding protein [Ewingella americana]MCI2143378.1 ATP-binding protein [Ewingella americana]MCI2164535.1 ATP-binding protein [Ewingella americana]